MRLMNSLMRSRAALAAVALALAVAGCESARQEPVDTKRRAVPAPLSALRTLLALDRAGGAADAPSGFPADFAAHPETAFESREWLAVLHDPAGRVIGFRQRIDRLALPPDASIGPGDTDVGQVAATATAGSGSAWRFSDVMRAEGAIQVGATAPPVEGARWNEIERVAVGLADPGFDPAFDDADARVLGHAISRRPAGVGLAPGVLPGADAGGGCAARWTIRAAATATLVADETRCPAARSSAGVALATSGALSIKGELVLGGAPVAVTGVAWHRQLWGRLPSLGGAVVFDRLIVTLAELGTLDLVRSKRRSGRGIAATDGTLDDGSGTGPRPLGSIEWLDLDGDPGRGRLRVEALGLDVELAAVAPVEYTDDGVERVWRGAVIADGSHIGAGFVDHRPVSKPVADAR